jgi:hypothetical protein
MFKVTKNGTIDSSRILLRTGSLVDMNYFLSPEGNGYSKLLNRETCWPVLEGRFINYKLYDGKIHMGRPSYEKLLIYKEGRLVEER